MRKPTTTLQLKYILITAAQRTQLLAKSSYLLRPRDKQNDSLSDTEANDNVDHYSAIVASSCRTASINATTTERSNVQVTQVKSRNSFAL